MNIPVCLLGVDAGTTSFKAVLYDEQGNELAAALHEYNLDYPAADRVEYAPEGYWQAFIAIVRQILTKSKKNEGDIKALAISSQGETLIAVDRQGQPLRPAIVWLDNRAGEEAQRIKAEFGAEHAFRTTGQPDIVPTWPAAKILWLRRHEPNLFRQVHRFLLLEDYLVFKLTGQFIAEGSLLSSTLYFDIRKGKWWDEMLDYIGISAEQLPEIRGSGELVGSLTDIAAKETGLAKETLVVTGALDQAASTIGAGKTAFDRITESTGSTLAICANIVQAVFDPQRRIPCHVHALPRSYFLLPWCQTAGMVYKWFRNEFYQKCGKASVDDPQMLFGLMDQEAAQIPPGSDGLVMLPHLAGAFTPESNPHARGILFGLSLQSTRAHIARAILESVAFMLKRNIGLLEELGLNVREIRSIGGGSKSRLWNQIKADITGKPIVTVKAKETASLGAAMLAGMAVGVYGSLAEAAERMIQIKDRIEPIPKDAEKYAAAFEKYVRLYDALEPLF